MSDRPTKTRRRKGGDAETPVASVTPHVEAPTGRSVLDRTGAVQAVRRTDQAEVRPAPKKAPKVEMDLSGLEELAKMDRGALASLGEVTELTLDDLVR